MSLKDMFWKGDTPKDTPEKMVPSPNLQKVYQDKNGAAYMPIPQSTVPTGQVDVTKASEFTTYLNKIMDDANLPGPDYYEFAKAIDTLKGAPLPEQQKYLTIFAAFQAQGITAQSLVDTAKQYIVILTNKKTAEFDASVESAIHTTDGWQANYDDLIAKNVELAKHIQENSAKAEQLLNDITTSKGKIEVRKTTFNMAFQSVLQKIASDIDNITKYLINGESTK